MDEDFIAVLRDACKTRRCWNFYECHRLFEAGSKTYLKLVELCQNPKIKTLLYSYLDSCNLAAQEKTVDAKELWSQVCRELCRASQTPSEETEIYQQVNEPNPIASEKQNAWWTEVVEAYRKFEAQAMHQSVESQRLIEQFVGQFRPQTEWTASLLESSGGKLTAVLLPDFEKPNKNNFVISPENKPSILRALNSGKIPLRDSHSKTLKDIVGRIVKGYETSDGKIVCEAEVEDSKIADLLKKYSENLGISLAGSGEGYCSVCNVKLESPLGNCPKHSKAPIVVRKFELREVSLTDSPAFSEAKILRYEED